MKTIDLDLDNEKDLKKFNDWRVEKSKELPSLAQRVFALRNKFYMGCGFHWSLERDLGSVIYYMNDFDNSYRKAEIRVIVEVRYKLLIKGIEYAETSAKKEESCIQENI